MWQLHYSNNFSTKKKSGARSIHGVRDGNKVPCACLCQVKIKQKKNHKIKHKNSLVQISKF